MNDNPYESPKATDQPRPNEKVSASRELREWLGLTPADLIVSVAVIALVAMYFVSDPVVDVVLAAIGLLLTVAACPVGMKRDPELSSFTNTAKLVSYPIFVLLGIGAIAAHYALFSR